MADKWKVMAIVFMAMFVIETIILIWAFNAGTNIIEKESECASNICEVSTEHEAYSYDDYEKICYCFDDGKITYKEYIG